MLERNVLLIGFSGVGKTTTGETLALRFDWHFTDIDAEIVRRHDGRFLHHIREELGTERYRQLEGQIVAELCGQAHQVIALGAGTLTYSPNWSVVRNCGDVVWLDASPETIYERLSLKYPNGVWLAQGDDPVGEIERKKSLRHEIYAAAPHKFLTDHKTPDQVVDGVIDLLS